MLDPVTPIVISISFLLREINFSMCFFFLKQRKLHSILLKLHNKNFNMCVGWHQTKFLMLNSQTLIFYNADEEGQIRQSDTIRNDYYYY